MLNRLHLINDYSIQFHPQTAENICFIPGWWGYIHRESLVGHLHRMDNPTQLLYYQLCLRMRNQGTPRLRFKDVAKRNMKRRNIDLDRCQVSANDRSDSDEPYSLKSIILSSSSVLCLDLTYDALYLISLIRLPLFLTL